MIGGRKMKRATAIYLASNLVGLLLFLWFVLRIEQFAHAEQRDYRDFGDSLHFLMTAVPVFLVCCAYSLVWGIKALKEYFRKRGGESLKALAAVICAWAALILAIRRFT
jgi:hypothetical protein